MTFLAAASSAGSSLTIAEIGGVLLVLGVLALLAVKLKLSSVPLFLLAGLALGSGGIVPVTFSEEFLNTGAQIGALLLLLLLGLEYSARELGEALRIRWSVSVLDFLVNAIPGAVIALILGWGLVGALVLGGITYVSSSGIAAQLIRETGWQRSEVASRTVSVLALEDIALAPLLPILSAVLSGISAVAGVISVSVAFVVTGLALLVSVRQERVISRLLGKLEPTGLLLTVFGFALLVAGLADLAGFSGAVAAFLVGLLLTGEVADSVRKRLGPLRDIFAAIFFVFFGLATTPASLIPALPAALALTVVGIAGKLFTGWWAARDMSDRMAWRRIGAFLVPRGEFSIVIAGLALTNGFAQELQAITIGYVILTALASTLLLRYFRSSFDR